MPRGSREEKERSRARIVANASRMLRARGPGSTSVADVMEASGLTHGGFYRHFPDKDELLAAAVTEAFTEFTGPLEQRLARDDAHDAVAAFVARYLSPGHVASAERGCPIAAAGPELARGGPAPRAAFAAGVRHLVSLLARGMRGPVETREARALRLLSQLVGAVVLARAGDADLARTVLASSRDDV